jgi:hypothetical protein
VKNFTHLVKNRATSTLPPAPTNVLDVAIRTKKTAAYAHIPANFAASTHNAQAGAVNIAFLVQNLAPGLASISDSAECLAAHRVTDSPATNGVPSFSSAGIAAHPSAGKYVLLSSSAKSVVPQRLKRQSSILLSPPFTAPSTWMKIQLSSSHAVTSSLEVLWTAH